MQDFYTAAMILSIATFTMSTVMSPGPNNIMLLSSGLTFGYKKTMPLMFGIILGFPMMVLIIGLGLGALFERFPIVLKVLKIVGILYLFWMAYKIAKNTSSYEIDENNQSKSFTFMQSALFQWVNPKAWTMALTANTTSCQGVCSYQGITTSIPAAACAPAIISAGVTVADI